VITLTLALSATAWGQITFGDSFSDGDFTSNPTWAGTDSTWLIVSNSDVAAGATNSFTLRLNKLASVSGTQYLSTQRTGSWGTSQSWSFWLGRRGQAATNANHSIVWLWANEADLTSSTVDGYRVRFGDDTGDDEVVLQRVDNGVATNILVSSGSVPNGLTDIGFMVRVTRTTASQWTIYTSTLPSSNGTGAVATDEPDATSTGVNQGTVTDDAYTDFSNGYFGFVAVHSSGSFPRQGAEFDQFRFDTSSSSSLPVQLTSFTAAANRLDAVLRWSTATETNNYGFEIERRSVGSNQYQKVGFVAGAGTSTSPREYSYVDARLAPGRYAYRIKQIDNDGSFAYYSAAELEIGAAAKVFALEPNYPNPFNPETMIEFTLPGDGRAVLKIYNTLGQEVATLFNEDATAGRIYQARFDGSSLPSGVYFYTLSHGGQQQVRKLLLVR
jgi:hypothetical protein